VQSINKATVKFTIELSAPLKPQRNQALTSDTWDQLGIGATKYIGVPPAFSSLGPSLPTNVVLSLAILVRVPCLDCWRCE
jgi:hypothetical protein